MERILSAVLIKDNPTTFGGETRNRRFLSTCYGKPKSPFTAAAVVEETRAC
jgi:hypothetical protein